jgi:hypothetical protein
MNIHLRRYWIRQREFAQSQIDAIDRMIVPTPDDLRIRDGLILRLHQADQKLSEDL